MYRWHQYVITYTILPTGNQFTDSGSVADTAADFVTVFRNWLIAEIESNTLDVPTARHYVALYKHTDPALNPSFAGRFQAMLDSCPQTESSYEVDQLMSECNEAFGWDIESSTDD